MSYCSSGEQHSKETQFLLGRDVSLLSFTLSSFIYAFEHISWFIKEPADRLPEQTHFFNYPRNVCASSLCKVIQFTAVAHFLMNCYSYLLHKNISFYCFLKQFMKIYLTLQNICERIFFKKSYQPIIFSITKTLLYVITGRYYLTDF